MSGAVGDPGWFARFADPDRGAPVEPSPAFLARVRALAPDRIGHLVRASHTSELEYGGCLLLVRVPSFPDLAGAPINDLIQIRWDGAELAGYWGLSRLGSPAEVVVLRPGPSAG